MKQRMQSVRWGRRTALRSRATRQSGVGLIEVLVAVLVLSVGFIGVAALQARSLSANNSSMTRSMATMASYSVLDAMRADLASAVGGSYNNTGSSAIKASACPAATGSLANAQLSQWCKIDLVPLGTSATGSINCSAAAGTSTAYCTVIVTFDDSRAGLGGSKTQQVTTQAML